MYGWHDIFLLPPCKDIYLYGRLAPTNLISNAASRKFGFPAVLLPRVESSPPKLLRRGLEPCKYTEYFTHTYSMHVEACSTLLHCIAPTGAWTITGQCCNEHPHHSTLPFYLRRRAVGGSSTLDLLECMIHSNAYSLSMATSIRLSISPFLLHLHWRVSAVHSSTPCLDTFRKE